MAEEPRQKRVLSKGISESPAKRYWLIVLQVSLVSFLFGADVPAPDNSPQVAFAYQSDLSLPLWGGTVAAVNTAMPREGFLENKIKLHHFGEMPCGNCHEAPITKEISSVASKSSWKTGVDINHSCTSFGCHDYDAKMNHPLDVPLPPRVMDTAASEISPTVTCLNCHLPQESDSRDTNEDQGPFLQDPGNVSCASCHEKLPGSIRQQSHWKFSQKAHLVSLKPASMNNEVAGDSDALAAGDIDMESNTCLSCHDEVTVTIPAMNETRQEKADRFRSMTDHPIGMNYGYILSQNKMYFNSLKGQERRIRMFDGKVGCGSCHSLYSDIPSKLTVEYEEESRLCHTCHNR